MTDDKDLNLQFIQPLIRVLLLLLVCDAAQSAMMLKTSSRIKGNPLNLYIMPLVVNSQNHDYQVEIAATKDNRNHYVKLLDFTQALDLAVTENNNQFIIDTAIGSATLQKSDCRIVNDYWVVDIKHLAQILAIDISIDQSTFAIYVSSLWYQKKAFISGEVIKPSGKAVSPDFKSSKNSLAYIRSEYFFRHQNDHTSKVSETEFGGRLLSGSWQVTARDYLDGEPFIEDYIWLNTTQNARYLIGNQSLSINPLIESTDFTGAQFAWSNQGIQPFLRNIQARQLINDANGTVRSFTGQGIPGGSVELRIDGISLARTITRLDGIFEFSDIEIPAGSYVQIEAWVFSPNENGAPIEIIDLSRYNSNRNLSNNTWLLQGGIGLNGNVIEDDDLDQVGYFRSQYTFNEHLTINSIVQTIDDREVGLIGTSGYLGRLGYWEVDSAFMGDKQAWRVETNNEFADWVFRAGIQHRPDGWLRDSQLAKDDSFAELLFKRYHSLQLSIINRRTQNENTDISYTLPAAIWRPHARFSLQARPDYNGDYMYRGNWKINRNQQLNAYSDINENAVQWNYKLSNNQYFNLQYLNRATGLYKTSMTYNQISRGLRSLGWSVGVIAGKHDWGYLAQLDYEFIPGLKVRGQVIKDPISTTQLDKADTILGLNVVANFNVSKGGLTRGSNFRPLNNTGTLSGRVSLSHNPNDIAFDDLWVLINGQRRVQTEQGGQFIVSSLSPGIYEVTLDLAGLPFELTPIKDTYWVEVAANANSYIEYEMALNLGLSGQLFEANGMAFIDSEFIITDTNGQQIIVSKTNLFGQFRVDGLPPGRYLAQDQQGHCVGFELIDQYLTFHKMRLSKGSNCEVKQ